MSNTMLKDFLNDQKIKYEVIEQPSKVYTAQEMAASTHIPGKQLAKTVMIKLDDELVMAVLPATHRVNLSKIKDLTAANNVTLATEAEFKDTFPDCELGAMPPFGNLYGIDVFAAECLEEEMEIAFCGGSHHELIRITFMDFKKLANPTVLDFSYQA